MIGALTYVMIAAPLAAIIGCLLRSARLSEAFNLVASAIAFFCALALPSSSAITNRFSGASTSCRPDNGLGRDVHGDRVFPRLGLCRGYMRLLNEDPGSSGFTRCSPALGPPRWPGR